MKPKVTISLDEYNELLLHKNAKDNVVVKTEIDDHDLDDHNLLVATYYIKTNSETIKELCGKIDELKKKVYKLRMELWDIKWMSVREYRKWRATASI